MGKCKHETSNGRCGLKESYAYRHECYTEECCKCHESIEPCGRHEPMTNADRIRAMSDEELAVFLEEASWICDNQIFCRECPLYTGTKECKSVEEWIKQPVEVDNG